jgi:hypothetical protein
VKSASARRMPASDSRMVRSRSSRPSSNAVNQTLARLAGTTRHRSLFVRRVQ